MLPYLIHASLLLGACYLFYVILLRRETYFYANRLVLLTCLGLVLLLPLIPIPAEWSLWPSPEEVSLEESPSATTLAEPAKPSQTTPTESNTDFATTDQETGTSGFEVLKAPFHETPKSTSDRVQFFTEIGAIRIIYFFGVLLFTINFIVQLILLLVKGRVLESLRDGPYRIVELQKEEAPFSFWKTIFINPTQYDSDTYEQILAHEKIHIDQKHFIDKLLAEVILILFWFNPFAWWYRRAIDNNLEYLTDAQMIQQGVEKKGYQLNLFKVAAPHYPLYLTTNYNQSFLKNRIAMMNAKKSSARSTWKYLSILPLLFFSMLFLNRVYSNAPEISSSIVPIAPDPVKESEEVTSLASSTNAEDSNLIHSPKSSITKKDKEVATPSPAKEEAEEKEPGLFEKNTEDIPLDILLNNHTPVFSSEPLPKLQELVDWIEQQRPANLDSLQPNQQAGFPEFPYSAEDMQRLLAGGPKLVDHLMEAIDIYAFEVAEWKEKQNKAEGLFFASEEGLMGRASKDETPSEGLFFEGKATKSEFLKKGKASDIELLRMSELRNNDHRALIRHRKTMLAPQAKGTAYWRWPAFQEDLLQLLGEEAGLDQTKRIKFYVGENSFYVNGQAIPSERVATYQALFQRYDIALRRKWYLYKKNDHIIVTDALTNISEFKNIFLDFLFNEQLINSKKAKVVLEIPGTQVVLNGKTLSEAQLIKVHEFCQQHHIQPVPGKVIKANNDKVSMMVGYHTDGNFTGTMMF